MLVTMASVRNEFFRWACLWVLLAGVPGFHVWSMEYGLYIDIPLSAELEAELFPPSGPGRPDWLVVDSRMGDSGFAILDRVRILQTKGAVVLDASTFRDPDKNLDHVYIHAKDFAWENAGRTDAYIIRVPVSCGSESLAGWIAVVKAVALGLAAGDEMAAVRVATMSLYPSPAQDLALMSGLYWYGDVPVLFACAGGNPVSGAHIDWLRSVWEGARLKKWVKNRDFSLWLSIPEPSASSSGRDEAQVLMDSLRVYASRPVGLVMLHLSDPEAKQLPPAVSRFVKEIRIRGNGGSGESMDALPTGGSSEPRNGWEGVSGSAVLSASQSYASSAPESRGDLPFAWDSVGGGWHRNAGDSIGSEVNSGSPEPDGGLDASGWTSSAGGADSAEGTASDGQTLSDSFSTFGFAMEGSPVVMELLPDTVSGGWSPSGLVMRVDSGVENLGTIRVWNLSSKAVAGAILTGGRRVGDRLKLASMGHVDVSMPLSFDRTSRIAVDSARTQSVMWQPDRPEPFGDSGKSQAVFLIREGGSKGDWVQQGPSGWQLLPLGEGVDSARENPENPFREGADALWTVSGGLEARSVASRAGHPGRMGMILSWKEVSSGSMPAMECAVRGFPRNGFIRIGLEGDHPAGESALAVTLFDRTGQEWRVHLDAGSITGKPEGVAIGSFEFVKVSGGPSHLRDTQVKFSDVNRFRIQLEGLPTTGNLSLWMEVHH
ncbi:MAG: hypothetical protein JW706_09385 [Opitutales bacterium]|nr:hypothetical protein [Opitutales bacterium]